MRARIHLRASAKENMMKYNAQVASVGTNTYIKGIGDMIETYVSKGYEPYMMTLIFNISRCRITPQEIRTARYRYGHVRDWAA